MNQNRIRDVDVAHILRLTPSIYRIVRSVTAPDMPKHRDPYGPPQGRVYAAEDVIEWARRVFPFFTIAHEVQITESAKRYMQGENQ